MIQKHVGMQWETLAEKRSKTQMKIGELFTRQWGSSYSKSAQKEGNKEETNNNQPIDRAKIKE